MTKTEILATDPTKKKAAALILPLFEEEAPSGVSATVDRTLVGEIAKMIKNGEIRGASGEVTLLPTFGKLPARTLVLVGHSK